MRNPLTLISILSITAVAGCHTAKPPATEHAPLTSANTYTDPTSQISFQYPAGWSTGRGKTAVVECISPDHSAKLSLDIPALPFHLPGMITSGAVANGYVNDVKKRLTNAVVEQNQEVTVPDASARRVKISGAAAGAMTTDSAVLILHADKVYILSSDGTGPSAAVAAKALDAAVQSLRWGK